MTGRRLSIASRAGIVAAFRPHSAGWRSGGKSASTCTQDLSPDEVPPLLRRAWETEERGWKGAAGTSVLQTPGASKFMLAQARWLAAEGRLRLAFLDCGGRNAAFCYGVLGKGVFHSFKIGYDPEFAAFSPGHLLQYHLLQALHGDPQVTAVDYIGEMTEYHASWRPEVYPFARLAFARRGSAWAARPYGHISA